MSPKPKKGVVKRGAWEVTKKILKAIPIIGPVITVAFAGHDIKKKGLLPGAVHVGLDVTPIVGTAKNVVEIFTGDLIPDKQTSREIEIINEPAKRAEESSPGQAKRPGE